MAFFGHKRKKGADAGRDYKKVKELKPLFLLKIGSEAWESQDG